MARSEPSLRQRSATSILWSAVRAGGDQVFNFVVFATLARLLGPSQFGVFIVALVFVELGKILAGSGLVSNLYRVPELTPQIADTIFWANLALGGLIAALGAVLATPIATALGDASAGPLIAALGLTVPISALGASHMSRNLRDFGHKALAVRSLLSGLIGGGLALLAAFNGFGVWSLVVQRFATEIISTAVAWWSFRWLPGLQVSWATLRDQLGLGGSVAGSQLAMVLLSRSQDVIISRVLGIGAVGIYRTAWKVTELIAQALITPFSTVSLPALAKLQHDREAFARGYVKLVGASALVSFPAIIGAGVLADQIIPLLFGQQWLASIPVAHILALLVVPFALDFFVDPALTALNKADLMMRMAIMRLAGNLVVCLAAAPYGLVAFAAAYVARTYLTMALQLWMFQRATGISPRRILVGIAPPLVAAVVMAIALIGLNTIVPQTSFGPLAAVIRLTCFVAAGGVVYAIALTLLVGRGGRSRILGELRSVLARRGAAPV